MKTITEYVNGESSNVNEGFNNGINHYLKGLDNIYPNIDVQQLDDDIKQLAKEFAKLISKVKREDVYCIVEAFTQRVYEITKYREMVMGCFRDI